MNRAGALLLAQKEAKKTPEPNLLRRRRLSIRQSAAQDIAAARVSSDRQDN
jgi:hypothetical protein